MSKQVYRAISLPLYRTIWIGLSRYLLLLLLLLGRVM
jgi:hypothetical protein